MACPEQSVTHTHAAGRSAVIAGAASGAAGTWSAPMAIVKDALPDPELVEIEQRAARALDVAPAPWNPMLETQGGLGGCSFIQIGDDPAVDNEMYIDMHLGTRQLTSPGARLDAVVDFVAHAPTDVARLIAEIRRLRSRQERSP